MFRIYLLKEKYHYPIIPKKMAKPSTTAATTEIYYYIIPPISLFCY